MEYGATNRANKPSNARLDRLLSNSGYEKLHGRNGSPHETASADVLLETMEESADEIQEFEETWIQPPEGLRICEHPQGMLAYFW